MILGFFPLNYMHFISFSCHTALAKPLVTSVNGRRGHSGRACLSPVLKGNVFTIKCDALPLKCCRQISHNKEVPVYYLFSNFLFTLNSH